MAGPHLCWISVEYVTSLDGMQHFLLSDDCNDEMVDIKNTQLTMLDLVMPFVVFRV